MHLRKRRPRFVLKLQGRINDVQAKWSSMVAATGDEFADASYDPPRECSRKGGANGRQPLVGSTSMYRIVDYCPLL